MTKQYAIKVKDMVKKFGSFTANDHLTFEVEKGEIFGFLGANGAGKTTAIKILCGLSLPTSGEIEVAGYNIYKEVEKVKKNIGYMSQQFSLYEDLTVKENFRFYGGIYGLKPKQIRERTAFFLSKLALNDSKNSIVSELPLGVKQKLAFSVANIHQPSIIFLDEPTGGVDPITRRTFWEMIYDAAEEGTTIFATTHYMDEAEYCNRISIMVEGRIEAIGTPEELKKKHNTATLDELFIKLARKEH